MQKCGRWGPQKHHEASMHHAPSMSSCRDGQKGACRVERGSSQAGDKGRTPVCFGHHRDCPVAAVAFDFPVGHAVIENTESRHHHALPFSTCPMIAGSVLSDVLGTVGGLTGDVGIPPLTYFVVPRTRQGHPHSSDAPIDAAVQANEKNENCTRGREHKTLYINAEKKKCMAHMQKLNHSPCCPAPPPVPSWQSRQRPAFPVPLMMLPMRVASQTLRQWRALALVWMALRAAPPPRRQ